MRIALILGLAVMATPALAEMTELQVAARAVVAPVIEVQVEGAHGVALIDCIVEHAKRRELRSLQDAIEGDERTVTLISNILNRPETVSCSIEKIAEHDSAKEPSS